MNYFKILGLVFGLLAFLKPFYMHILPWDENAFIKKTYSEKRPTWVTIVAIIGLLLVAFTWYKHFTSNISYSIVITVLFSLTIVKGVTLLFNYQAFHHWVSTMLTKNNGKKIVYIDIAASVFGLLLIILSIIFY